MAVKNVINPQVLAVTFVLVAIVIDVAEYIWHGILQQPSLMNLLYPGFWNNLNLLLMGFVGSLVFAYVFGYLSVWIFNWVRKKIK